MSELLPHLVKRWLMRGLMSEVTVCIYLSHLTLGLGAGGSPLTCTCTKPPPGSQQCPGEYNGFLSLPLCNIYIIKRESAFI